MEWNVIAQWAHDIRNTLGTVALYLESRSSTPVGGTGLTFWPGATHS